MKKIVWFYFVLRMQNRKWMLIVHNNLCFLRNINESLNIFSLLHLFENIFQFSKNNFTFI